ncbi:MAG: glycoside hydrolase family 43 protein, partial [Prevotella sp.]|nr:glycoside hydrolase family 43 protein [Prevotella sp.]
YMVATDMKSAEGWASNRGMVLMKSKDLVNWQHSTVHFPEKYAGTNFANVTRVWAPETIWDPEAGKYMIYFSLLTNDGTIPYDKVFYCYANEDFTDLEGEPTLLFDLGYSVIDMDIVYNDADGLYHGFFKNEDKGGILKVTSKTLTAPEGAALGSQWGNMSGRLQQTNVAVEGAGVFKLLDGKTWVLMYDCYSRGYYQFCTSTDLNTFTFKQNTTTSGMFTPRHGSVITLTDAEVATINNAIAQKAHARIQAELEEEIRNALALGIDVKEAMALANDPMASNEALTDMTQQLKVAEYAAVESTYTEDVTTTYLGTWRESGGTNNANKGQHWDGTSTSTYMEQSGNNWGRSSWSIAYQQDVKLPAGSYVLKVAGRSSSSVVASMNVNGQSVSFPAKGDTGYGISTDGKTNFSPDATYANNNNGRGWEWRYIPFEVKENGTINISLLAEASSSHQWVSFANVSLMHKVPSKIHAMEVFEEGANLYNLQGQRIGSPLSTIPQKSIVIKNHKKFVSR